MHLLRAKKGLHSHIAKLWRTRTEKVQVSFCPTTQPVYYPMYYQIQVSFLMVSNASYICRKWIRTMSKLVYVLTMFGFNRIPNYLYKSNS